MQPHRQLSALPSDTAQPHLNEFIGLGMGQNAWLCLKKSLDITAKSTMWCDHGSLGRLRATECLKEKGWDCQWTMPKKEGRARALLLGVLFPNTFLYGKFSLTSARLMHLRNPAFSTDVCCLLLKPALPHFHVCQ